MAKEFIPHICGENKAYIPKNGCDDCAKLEKRVSDLEDTRLKRSDIHAGTHITIVNGQDNNLTINADLSNYYNKAQVDNLLNAIEVGEFVIVQSLPQTGNPRDIYLVPKQGGGYTEHVYIDGAWEQIGDTSITLDKTSILTALGYRETTIKMIDTNNAEVEVTVLVADN